MLTSKQIKSLPKGMHKNSDLAAKFKTHGKPERVHKIPVDKHGNVVDMISVLQGKTKVDAFVNMRLNRAQHKQRKSKS